MSTAQRPLSPYQTEHINRFGNYVLDLGKPPLPLPVDLSLRIAEPGPPHVVTVPV